MVGQAVDEPEILRAAMRKTREEATKLQDTWKDEYENQEETRSAIHVQVVLDYSTHGIHLNAEDPNSDEDEEEEKAADEGEEPAPEHADDSRKRIRTE
jgi:hypothetical protein